LDYNSVGYQQNCGQSILPYIPCIQNYPCHCDRREPADFELRIEQIGSGEPRLHYGEKLRLVMADPVQGVDLRDAIAKLKTALKECFHA
jgi:hypothetical protein